jgi:hypothetical protein
MVEETDTSMKFNIQKSLVGKLLIEDNARFPKQLAVDTVEQKDACQNECIRRKLSHNAPLSKTTDKLGRTQSPRQIQALD